MIQFWVGAALLIVAALVAILPPLLRTQRTVRATERKTMNIELYRDQLADLESDLQEGSLSQEQYATSRQELEHRLLEDVDDGEPAKPVKSTAGARVLAAGVALGIPLLAVGLYLKLGTLDALNPQVAQTAETASPHISQQQIQEMVGKLAERMKANPQDAEGWVMLGRSYAVMQRFPEAAKAFENAVNLGVNDPKLLTDYADILAMSQGRRLAGKPLEMVERALAIDPSNQKGLALAGTAEYERGNYQGAIDYWQRLLKTVPEGSDAARQVMTSIEDARAGLTGQGGQAPMTTAKAGAAAPAGGAKVSGTVTLDPAIAKKASPNDTLFVFARAVQGPKMPLAIQRVQVKDLPLTFSLDDSMAMSPAMKLSSVPEVMVGARVSKSGNAMPQTGDLEGMIGPVKPGSSGLKIVIGKELP